MILNPLKKENNTEALVKALEDANGTSSVGTDNPAADQTAGTDAASSTDATMPGAVPADTPSPSDQMATPDLDLPNLDESTPAEPSTSAATPEEQAETTTSEPAPVNTLNLDESTLPAGISSDADAHLDSTSSSSGDGELDGVKKSALEQLRPLIEKLDLEPADKFDKYLMMLRASDDPTLIKPAFDAAQGITGEKEKAQALLDIINEINYITASKQQSQA